MLHDLERLGKDFQSRFEAIKIWPEIKFSEEDKSQLSKLNAFTKINTSTVQIKTSDKSHCIIPSQYFLYAVLIKQFALALKDYTDIVEALKVTGNANTAWDAISNSDLTNQVVSSLDSYSKNIVYLPFKKGHCVMGAKDILNGSSTDRTLRGAKDFFGSVILKIINVPDVSSSEVGKLIYELTTKKDVYDYLEKRYLSELPFICFENSIGEFVRSVLSFIEQYDDFSKLKPLIKVNADPRLQSIEYDANKLTSIFLTSSTVATVEELSHGGTKRFFEEPLFLIDNKYFHLSTQWTNTTEEGRLDLNAFKRVIEAIYPEFSIDLNGKYIFKYKNTKTSINSVTNAVNLIYYGAPGTGKSHSVDSSIDKSRTVRTVFHADTQYSDFVGCLKPISIENKVTYSFRPGPFCICLINALNDPENHYWLVIEEINRAPAAAVFGEIFQLLDRDEIGKSKYSITPSDQDMVAFIDSELSIKLVNGSIYIPPNLSILATMNSSDQAVMPMDTAFKRRWRFKYIPLGFDNCTVGTISLSVPVRGKIGTTWSIFAQSVNTILSDLEIPEDRHLGPFFLNQNELKDLDSQSESVTGKLFMYLWDDVLRHGYRPELFRQDIKTYGQLTLLHSSNELVFSEKFYTILESNLPPITSILETIAAGESGT